MTTKSQAIGKTLINGIGSAEMKAHRVVTKGARSAKNATRKSTTWAARRETAAVRKVSAAKRDLTHGATAAIAAARAKAHEIVDSSDVYVRRHPWKALAVISAAALVMGALLDRKSNG